MNKSYKQTDVDLNQTNNETVSTTVGRFTRIQLTNSIFIA